MHITVVVPVLNEAGSLPELYQELVDNLTQVGHPWELLFVDDGSSDGTFEILQGLHTQDERVSVVRFRRNFGKSAALSAAFQRVSPAADVVFTMDGDLQDDPAEMTAMLEKLDEGYDVVVGWKVVRRDPLQKTLPSKLFNWTMRKMSGVPIHDFNCGFKLLRREVLDELQLYGEMHRFVPALASWRGFKVTEMRVNHRQRRHGKSKYGIERLARGFFDFMTVYFLANYQSRPLHFFGAAGLGTLVTGLLINVYLAAQKLAGHAIGHRPLLTLGVLLMMIGLQILLFGVLAEMLNFLRRGFLADYAVSAELGKGTDA